MYQFTRRAIKLTVLIIEEIAVINFIQNVIEYPSLKVKFIGR
jgi:hypothetical protein